MGKVALLAAAGLFLYLSIDNFDIYAGKAASRPDDVKVSMWMTPQGLVVPVLAFSPGQPTITVSLERFKQEVGNGQYQVFLSESWRDAPVKENLFQEGTVTYHAKIIKGGIEHYFAA